MNLLYIAQFHETCGYSHAALGYLKSLDLILKNRPDVNLKILSVSLDPKKVKLAHQLAHIEKQDLDLLDKYHFISQEELNNFLKLEYKCVWHMTSILPVILKRPQVQHVYKDIDVCVEDAIKGSVENYHILAWETDEVPQEYKKVIQNYNPEKVLTPSQWNKETVEKFHTSAYLPHLIEQKDKSTETINLPDGFENKFSILCVSEWTRRKNFEGLLQAFMSEFYDNDDVVLVVKTTPPTGVTKQQLVELVKNIKQNIRTPRPKKQNMVFILDYISREKMNYLYQNTSAFCLPSFGEGFSLPISEAVMSKKPVICTPHGGHIDYLSSDNPYSIDGMWETVFDSPPYDIDGNWFVPSVKGVRESMRKAYEDWLNDPSKLESVANENLKVLESGPFDRESIGNIFLDSIQSRDTTLSKIEKLKTKIQNLPLDQKMSTLHNSFIGEDCYILNCGPSLSDYDSERLSNFLKDKLVLSVKQAYDLFSEVTDFHFFNCSNLPQRESNFDPHYKNSKTTITVSSSNYEQYMRWKLNQSSDIFFKIPIRTEINNEFLVRTGKIDDFLISKNLTRPCGPGIMYETVLFMAIHLGVKSITCIGWDLTKEKVNENTYNHFYGSTSNLVNRGDILDWEIRETREFSKDFYKW